MIKAYGARTTPAGGLYTAVIDPGVQRLILTANLTVTLPVYPADGIVREVDLHLIQDATGGRTVIVKNAATSYGAAAVIDPTPGARTVIRCVSEGEGWDVYVAGALMSIPTGWAVV